MKHLYAIALLGVMIFAPLANADTVWELNKQQAEEIKSRIDGKALVVGFLERECMVYDPPSCLTDVIMRTGVIRQVGMLEKSEGHYNLVLDVRPLFVQRYGECGGPDRADFWDPYEEDPQATLEGLWRGLEKNEQEVAKLFQDASAERAFRSEYQEVIATLTYILDIDTGSAQLLYSDASAGRAMFERTDLMVQGQLSPRFKERLASCRQALEGNTKK